METPKEESPPAWENCEIVQNLGGKPRCGAVWCSEWLNCPLRDQKIGGPKASSPGPHIDDRPPSRPYADGRPMDTS